MANQKHKLTNKDYEAIGRIVTDIVDSSSADKIKVYKTAFIKGLFSGFGGVIGATLLVTLLIWILGLFGEVPLIGNLVESIEKTVDTTSN
jgi:Domain of unknown function (DUF5665)